MANSRLCPATAQAFADLLPLLLCGEESASMAFDDLARISDDQIAGALRDIAREERGHDALLDGVRAQLPDPTNLPAARAAARHFYVRLQERDPVRHLARITALDSAICIILAALTRAGRGITADPNITDRLRRIHREEVGHVRIGLSATTGLGRGRAPLQEETRAALTSLLTPFGDRFEALSVDPDVLFPALNNLSGALRV